MIRSTPSTPLYYRQYSTYLGSEEIEHYRAHDVSIDEQVHEPLGTNPRFNNATTVQSTPSKTCVQGSSVVPVVSAGVVIVLHTRHKTNAPIAPRSDVYPLRTSDPQGSSDSDQQLSLTGGFCPSTERHRRYQRR